GLHFKRGWQMIAVEPTAQAGDQAFGCFVSIVLAGRFDYGNGIFLLSGIGDRHDQTPESCKADDDSGSTVKAPLSWAARACSALSWRIRCLRVKASAPSESRAFSAAKMARCSAQDSCTRPG